MLKRLNGWRYSLLDRHLRPKRPAKIYALSEQLHDTFISPYVVLPDTTLVVRWTFLNFVYLLYSSIVIPFRIAFMNEQSAHTSQYYSWIILDNVLDVIIWVDIALQAYCFAVVHNGRVVTSRREILWIYTRRWLKLDVLSVLPFELIALAHNDSWGISLGYLLAWLRLNRLLRYSRLNRYFNALNTWLEAKRMHRDSSVMRLVKVFFFILNFGHWLACVWYFLGRTEDLNSASSRFSSWIYVDGVAGQPLGRRYIRSLYYVLTTMATVGYGDIVPHTLAETCLALVIMMLGGLIYSAVVACMASIVSILEASATDFRLKVDYLKRYAAYRKLPEEYVEKVTEYHNALWQRQKGAEEVALLQALPASLRAAVYRTLNFSILKKVPMFSHCGSLFLHSLVNCLQPRLYIANTIIVHKGEIGHEMFVVVAGKVEITNATCALEEQLPSGFCKSTRQHSHEVLGDCTFFGEASLFELVRREYAVRALTEVQIYILTKDRFDPVVAMYPSVKEQLLEQAKLICDAQAAPEGSKKPGGGGGGALANAVRMTMRSRSMSTSKDSVVGSGIGGIEDGAETSSLLSMDSSSSITHHHSNNSSSAKSDSILSRRGTVSTLRYSMLEFPEVPEDQNEEDVAENATGEGGAVSPPSPQPLSIGSNVPSQPSSPSSPTTLRFPLCIESPLVDTSDTASEASGNRFRPKGLSRLESSDSLSSSASTESYSRRESRAALRATTPSITRIGVVASHMRIITNPLAMNPNKPVLMNPLGESNRYMQNYRHSCYRHSQQMRQEDIENLSMKRSNSKRFRTLFHPMSTFRNIWESIMLLAISYNVLVIPFRVAFFFTEGETSMPGYAFDYLFDVCFILDIYLCFNHFSILEDGKFATELTQIRQAYFRGKFKYDLLASIPLDLIATTAGAYMLPLLRINKLIRIENIGVYLSNLEHAMEGRGVRINSAVIRVVKLFLLIIVLSHYVSSAWYMISFYSKASSAAWINRDPGQVNMGSRDIRSLYWSFTTLTTVGYGDIVPGTDVETVFTVVIFLVFTSLFPAVIGTMTQLAQNRDATRIRFQRKQTYIREYIRFRQIPDGLRDRIKTYYDLIWSSQKAADESYIVESLPPAVRADLFIHMCGEDLKNIPLFKDFDSSFFREIAVRLRPTMLPPNEFLIRKGCVLSSLSFLKSGVLELMSADGKSALSTLQKGTVIGELAPMAPYVQEVAVRAQTRCDIFSLFKEDFQHVLEKFPHLKVTMWLRAASLKNKKEKTANIVNNLKAKKLAKMTVVDVEQVAQRKIYLPSDRRRRIWDLILMLTAVYSFLFVPFRVAFYWPETHGPGAFEFAWFGFDYFLDCLYILDCYLNARHFAHFYKGELVTKPNLIFHTYLHKYFVVDILTMFPYDIFALIHPSMRLMCLLRIPKLLRAIKLPSQINSVEKFVEENNIRINIGKLRIVQLFILVLVSQHLIGCFWFFIAAIENEQGDTSNWAVVDGVVDAEVRVRYLRSFYWAVVTMNTIGYGDITPRTNAETVFTIFVELIGATLYANVIAEMASLVENLDAAAAAYRKKMDYIVQYMKHQAIPYDIRQRITAYYEHIWVRQRAISEAKIWKELPSFLREDVAMFLMKSIFNHKAETMFDKCNDHFLQDLAGRLVPVIFSPQDLVWRSGDVRHEMYFLIKGTVELVSDEGFTVYGTIYENSCFGEEALFTHEPRKANLRAKTYCDILVLTRKAFEEVAALYEDQTTYMKQHLETKGSTTASVQEIQSNLLKNTKLQRLLKMQASKAEEKEKKKVIVFALDHRKRLWWEMAMMALVIYQAYVVPFRAAFLLDPTTHNNGLLAWMIIDYMLDIFLYIDIYLHMYHFACSIRGRVVSDPVEFKSHYLRTYFAFDLLACLPWDLCAIGGGMDFMFLFRIPKALRCVRLFYYFRRVEAFIEARHIQIDTSVLRLIRLFGMFLLLSHWNGCVWYAVAFWNSADHLTWVIKDEITDATSLVRYIRSVYFALTTMVSVGYGDIIPTNDLETIFAMWTIQVGSLMYAGVIASITAILGSLDATALILHKRVDCLKQYMNFKRLPPRLQQRLLRYYDYLWKQQKGLDEAVILADLPRALRQEVSLHLNRSTVDKVVEFRDCHQSFKAAICMVLKPLVVAVHEYIVHRGEIGKEMYFIHHGTVAVIKPKLKSVQTMSFHRAAEDLSDDFMEQETHSEEDVLATLSEGQFFGEIALFYSVPRTASVQAQTYTNLYVLTEVDFNEVLQSYPQYKQQMMKIAGARLNVIRDMLMKQGLDTSILEQALETAALYDDTREAPGGAPSAPASPRLTPRFTTTSTTSNTTAAAAAGEKTAHTSTSPPSAHIARFNQSGESQGKSSFGMASTNGSPRYQEGLSSMTSDGEEEDEHRPLVHSPFVPDNIDSLEQDTQPHSLPRNLSARSTSSNNIEDVVQRFIEAEELASSSSNVAAAGVAGRSLSAKSLLSQLSPKPSIRTLLAPADHMTNWDSGSDTTLFNSRRQSISSSSASLTTVTVQGQETAAPETLNSPLSFPES